MPPLRAVAPPPSKRSTISVFAPLSCAAIAALAPAAPKPTTRTSQRQSQCSADSSSTTRALSIGKVPSVAARSRGTVARATGDDKDGGMGQGRGKARQKRDGSEKER